MVSLFIYEGSPFRLTVYDSPLNPEVAGEEEGAKIITEKISEASLTTTKMAKASGFKACRLGETKNPKDASFIQIPLLRQARRPQIITPANQKKEP